MIFEVPVIWEAYNKIPIEADSLAEALLKLNKNMDIPWARASYIEGSFLVDLEGIKEATEEEVESLDLDWNVLNYGFI